MTWIIYASHGLCKIGLFDVGLDMAFVQEHNIKV